MYRSSDLRGRTYWRCPECGQQVPSYASNLQELQTEVEQHGLEHLSEAVIPPENDSRPYTLPLPTPGSTRPSEGREGL